MSQNLYSYVGNNPINYVDPTGHNGVPLWNLRATDGDWDGKPWWRDAIEDQWYIDGGGWLESTEPLGNTEIPTLPQLASLGYNTVGGWLGMSIVETTIPMSGDIYKYGTGDHAKLPRHSSNVNMTGQKITARNISSLIAAVGYGFEIANTLTADSGNTWEQRFQKMGIQTVSAFANVVVGVGGGTVAAGGTIGSGGVATLPSIAIGAGFIAAGVSGVASWQESMYDLLEIN